jgi:hypothetical protein
MVGEISEEKHGVPHRIPSSNKDMYLKIGSLLLLLFMEAASFGMLMPLMPVVTTEVRKTILKITKKKIYL